MAFLLEDVEYIDEPQNKPQVIDLRAREKRFICFASVEYNGQLYMTPEDFLGNCEFNTIYFQSAL